jgi:hypothetical protein
MGEAGSGKREAGVGVGSRTNIGSEAGRRKAVGGKRGNEAVCGDRVIRAPVLCVSLPYEWDEEPAVEAIVTYGYGTQL